jgi:hypothetical protein
MSDKKHLNKNKLIKIMDKKELEYTKDQLKKHLILLEDHLKSGECPWCIDKHLTAIEGYSEEGITQTNNIEEKMKFIKIAESARKLRKML